MVQADDGFGNAEDVMDLGNIVYANDVGSGPDSAGYGCGGGPGTFFGRFVDDLAEKVFAACSQQNRAVKFEKAAEFAYELVVLRGCFTKADAGIDDDLFAANAGGLGRGDALTKVSKQVLDKIVVVDVMLHIGRGFADVHQDDGRAAVSNDTGHVGIEAEGADVVDDIGTGLEGLARDFGFVGVDGDGDVALRAESLDERDGALEFFGEADALCAGACGFAADVDDVGAGLDQLQGVFECGGVFDKPAAVGEGIGRGVDDSHEVAAFIEGKHAVGELNRGRAMALAGAGDGSGSGGHKGSR